jgi:hypothetical protein
MATQPEEPEEFFESEFVEGWWGWWSGRERKRITFTGFLWIVAPWWLIFRHRLKFGLGDLVLVVACLGSSIGIVVRGVAANPWWLGLTGLLAFLCVVVHSFAVAVVWELYYWNYWPESFRRYGLTRFRTLAIVLIPLTVLWHLVGVWLNG